MTTIFFDMDGTLIESSVGITRCIAHALERMGVPVPDPSELKRWIGPSLRESFTPLLHDPSKVEQAVEHYRDRFESIGWQEHTVYPGIADAVESLHTAGHRLAIVTAKNEPHARLIAAHLPFGSRFVEIVGATADGSRSHKEQLVGEALRRLDADPVECVMIGDRRHDVEGALAHGVGIIGVAWGFGGAQELREAGARHIADVASALPALVAAWSPFHPAE